MNRYIKTFMILALVALATLNACKDPEAPKATVTVINSINENTNLIDVPAEGAVVTVFSKSETGKTGYADPDNKDLTKVKIADGAGKCSFEFELENILQVKAELAYGGDTLYGEGAIVLEEDETENIIIHLRKYKSQF